MFLFSLVIFVSITCFNKKQIIPINKNNNVSNRTINNFFNELIQNENEKKYRFIIIKYLNYILKKHNFFCLFHSNNSDNENHQKSIVSDDCRDMILEFKRTKNNNVILNMEKNMKEL